MIRLTLKGLAKYLAAAPAARRKILQDFKYPDPEGRAQAAYYREARDRIGAYHRNGHLPAWLQEQAGLLGSLAKESFGRSRTRLTHNARALAQYAAHFAAERWKLLEPKRLSLTFRSVQVSVYPDLHVEKEGREMLVKLEFGEKPLDPVVFKVMSQALFEAARRGGVEIANSGALVLDVPRAVTHKGGRLGARLAKDIEVACEDIETLWPSLPAPRKRGK